MNIDMKLYDSKEGKCIDDPDELMSLSGQDPRMGFSGLAILDEGIPIVCDACGNYGFLDSDRYKIQIKLD